MCDKLKNIFLCVQTFGRDLGSLGTHENTCDMECLHNYKHAYQYMTNYDVDEFIFPRRFSKNHFNDLENIRDLKCSLAKNNTMNGPSGGLVNLNYGSNMMHEYIQRLIGIYGNQAAFFHFQNYLVLNEFENLLDKISDNLLLQSSDGNKVFLDYENRKRSTNLRFWFKNSSKVNRDYFDSFKTLSQLTKCLEKSNFKNNSELDSKWRKVLMSQLNNRSGKSIFNTDYVNIVNYI